MATSHYFTSVCNNRIQKLYAVATVVMERLARYNGRVMSLKCKTKKESLPLRLHELRENGRECDVAVTTAALSDSSEKAGGFIFVDHYLTD